MGWDSAGSRGQTYQQGCKEAGTEAELQLGSGSQHLTEKRECAI